MLTVCVQAGGESRRMGQDKALMPFLGRPLIQRVVEPRFSIESGLRSLLTPRGDSTNWS